MEWVETTGKTVEEAVDAALDELGVAEDDAEVQVVEEPKPGLFGRMRGEARVRVRVKPTQPRPKEDRRDRRRRSHPEPGGPEGGLDDVGVVAPAGEAVVRGPRDGHRGDPRENGTVMEEDVSLDEQAAEAVDFLTGLVSRLDLPGQVTSEILDADSVEVRVAGGDLGVLIGPRGMTLSAVQELTRTVVQRRLNAHNGRLTVDVSGYRQKRKVALERFTNDVAEQVRSSGQRRVLEAMPAADRKIVHDTANGIDGVTTTSEGEDPRRRVVILPQP